MAIDLALSGTLKRRAATATSSARVSLTTNECNYILLLSNLETEWWSLFFNEHWLTSEGVKSQKVNVTSVDFIEKTWKVQKGGKILDLGCGYGRLSIELAGRGYDVVGLDYSEPLLE